MSGGTEEDIRAMIKANPNITIDQLRLKVMEKYDINIGRSTIHGLMKKLSFSYITPRPRHYKSNKVLQEEFKKNLRDHIKKDPKVSSPPELIQSLS